MNPESTITGPAPADRHRSWIIRACLVLVVACISWLGYNLAAPPPPPSILVQPETPPPTATSVNPAEVFQRAFWRRPADDDKILHAERREWSDKDGVSQWQWFLAVQPGPSLQQWLKSNPFSLSSTRQPKPAVHAPDWFPASLAGHEVEQGNGGRFLMFRDEASHTLYATDGGFGFHAGAPQPLPPVHAPLPPVKHPPSSPPRS